MNKVRQMDQRSRAARSAGVLALLTTVVTAAVLSCTGCPGATPTPVAVGAAVVDCFAQGRPILDRVEEEVLKFGVIAASSDPDRWNKIELLAANEGISVGGCAFAHVVNEWLTRKTLGTPDAVADTHVARATFEEYRAKYASGATFRTSRGDM